MAAAIASATATAGALAADLRSAPIVNCFDEARNLVTPTRRSACEGRVVDDAEAARIRASRADHVRRLLQGKQELFPGRSPHKIGTGFFVAPDGTVLTNSHVVDGCPALSVETPAGTDSVGRVLAQDPALDLALIAAADAAPTGVAAFAPANGTDLRPGARADLVGYPTQGIVPERPLMSAGTVAPKPPGLEAPGHFLVETDVRSGNSGGPVLDGQGRVIGVVFAQLDTPKILKQTGRMLPDTAVAIGAPTIQAFLRRHNVAFATADNLTPVDRAAVREQAQSYVARIQCWR